MTRRHCQLFRPPYLPAPLQRQWRGIDRRISSIRCVTAGPKSRLPDCGGLRRHHDTTARIRLAIFRQVAYSETSDRRRHITRRTFVSGYNLLLPRRRRSERGSASFRCLAIADHVTGSRDATDVGTSCIGLLAYCSLSSATSANTQQCRCAVQAAACK